ncbi:MAG TPA: glycogen synthase GlgA [Vicinamibacterales bacterium]|jgi:starch synthase
MKGKDTKEPKEAKEPKVRRSAGRAKGEAPRGRQVAQGAEVSVAAPAGEQLDILFITSEMRPFARTGGLSDVSSSLPGALARLGHRVTVVLPRYRGAQVDAAGWSAEVPFGLHAYPVRFVEQPVEPGVAAVLIDAPALFDRDGLYGDARGEFGDNAFRFAVLCRGALEYARLKGTRPSVIHTHDWQAALAPAYLRTVLRDDPIVGGVKTVLTIHNLAFQGAFDSKELTWIGLGRDLYTPDVMEFWGRASSLKAGIVLSDVITTVSPTYAREILRPEHGFGFDGVLRSRARDLVGILNGIDTDVWNPASDAHLAATFTAASLAGRRTNKRAVLEAAGLPIDAAALARPLIGIVTRLTQQKGCDLYAGAGERLLEPDASWVILGSGDGWCEDFWKRLSAARPDRVAARIGFDDGLAHLIEGGADIFLMPSWYEPCGLNQMYSQRYGTLPIVRATGGLEDTVVDADRSPDGGTGFKFEDYTPEALLEAIARAVRAFANPKTWKHFQRNAMRRDFSWDVSAREYVKVYRGY